MFLTLLVHGHGRLPIHHFKSQEKDFNRMSPTVFVISYTLNDTEKCYVICGWKRVRGIDTIVAFVTYFLIKKRIDFFLPPQ